MSTPDRWGSPGWPDAVRLESVSKRFGRGDGQVIALREVTIGIPRGTFRRNHADEITSGQ